MFFYLKEISDERIRNAPRYGHYSRKNHAIEFILKGMVSAILKVRRSY